MRIKRAVTFEPIQQILINGLVDVYSCVRQKGPKVESAMDILLNRRQKKKKKKRGIKHKLKIIS